MISVVLAVCLLILIISDYKNFSSDKKMMWFGLAGFLLVRRAFSTAA
jgi:hypothetical protein